MDTSCFSTDKKRNNTYLTILQLCRLNKITVKDIIHLSHRLMRQAKLHPHFFGNNSLLNTAQYLVFFSLKFPQEYSNHYYLNTKITEESAIEIIKRMERRISERIPVEYITNEANYFGNDFYVNKHVLVPRSIINTRFHDFLNEINWQNNQVLDLCAGSGCIGITLALLNPKLHVDLADICPKALAVADINIKKYALQERVKCIQTDLFANIQKKYDLIITNPPYVSTFEYQKSKAEFKNEPKLALESGWDGLDIIHRILSKAKHYLNPQGKLIAEVGCAAARRIKRRYRNISFQWLKYRNPNGKQSLLAMDCILVCEAKDLPHELQLKNYNVFYKWIDRIKDLF